MRSEEFWHLFHTRIKPELAGRAETFEQMFLHLDQFDRPVGIIETGCTQQAGTWAKTGCSTILFDIYAKLHPGSVVYTVDLDAAATQQCRELVSDHVRIHTGDSVAFLKTLSDAPPSDLPFLDLLYLDSYDIDFDNPTPSAVHHLKELIAITPLIRSKTLIAVDDSPMTVIGYSEHNKFSMLKTPRIGGKAKYIAEYAEQIGAVNVFSSYQCGWTNFRNA